MPSRSGSRPYGSAQVSQYQRKGGAPGGSSSTIRTTRSITVDVATGDWTADSSGYVNAPNPIIGTPPGTARRADVMHYLGSEDVMCTGFRDASGRIHAAAEIVDQQLTTGNTFNGITIWLADVPSGTITIYVESY